MVMNEKHAVGGRAPTTLSSAGRLLSIMDRLEYRRIVAADDLQDVGRLRLQAYNARQLYHDKFDGPVVEALDFAPGSFVFGLYYDGQLVSSLRLNVVEPGCHPTSAMLACPDTLNPLLEQGMRFVELSRFAINREAVEEVPLLPALTHRLSVMMTIHIEADYCIGLLKLKHEAYYRRMFRATRLAGPFVPEGMFPDTVLLGVSRANQDYVTSRNPIFFFTKTEARLLFDEVEETLPPLCVRPTARYALRARAAA